MRPVVKFRDISKTVLDSVQIEGPREADSADKDDDSDSDLDNEDSDEVDKDRTSAMSENTLPQHLTFEIDADIDIDSPTLWDMVSTEPVVQKPA